MLLNKMFFFAVFLFVLSGCKDTENKSGDCVLRFAGTDETYLQQRVHDLEFELCLLKNQCINQR